MGTRTCKIIGVLFLIFSGSCLAQPPTQTTDRNKVTTNTPQKAGITDITQIDGKSVNEVSQTVQYLDDLGRPTQTINTMASPGHNDVIIRRAYDLYGREVRKFLPFTESGTPGEYKPQEALYSWSTQYLFYQNTDKVAHDKVPYSDAVFENSPLGRVLKQGAPGALFNASPVGTDDHSVEYAYLTNGYQAVLRLDYSASTNSLIFSGPSYYDAQQLIVKKITDEHGFETIEYTDKKQGHIVCRKVEYGKDDSSNRLYAETYYIYDDLGNLMIVLPPEATVELRSMLSN